MARFNISICINESLQTIWKAYIDPQNMLKWTRNLEKVEIIKGKFGEIGATAHLHYLEKGKSYILEDKLLEFESEKRILSQVSGQGMNIIVETIFGIFKDNTKISINWKGTSKSIIARFFLKILQKKIANRAKAELNLFKDLVESHGVKFP